MAMRLGFVSLGFLQLRRLRGSVWGLCLLLPACGLLARSCVPAAIPDAEFSALYETAPAPRDGPLRVYYMGHSLIGYDMPVMVQALAGAGHVFHSQLGWGANMNEHWDPEIPVKGFAESNTHPQHRDPHEAIASGAYDAIVITEAVEIRDAIEYADPAYFLREIAVASWQANPDARVYFYETWHQLDDPEGWLVRIDGDLKLYWEDEILRRALAYDNVTRPIYVIPGGQVMAAFVRAVEARGGVGPIRDRGDLFTDAIHFNDYGAYLMALTHYAVLYGRSPLGLPHRLAKLDGTQARDPGPEAARLMQETVWSVVTSYPPTGVPARP